MKATNDTVRQPTVAGHWFLASMLVFVWFVMTFWRFEAAYLFHGDHERDLRFATLFVQHGIWPESTPSISPTPFELGPLLYVVMAPGILFSPDPLVLQAYFLLLSAGGFMLLYACWVKRLPAAAAMVGLFALLGSTFTFEMSRQLWHSSLLPVFIGGFFFAGERLLRVPTSVPMAIMAAICAAVSVQLHMAASVYVLLGLGLIAICRQVAWQGLGVGLLAATPLLWTNWNIIRSGAAERLSQIGSTSRWAPAAPSDVFGFFVDNIHMVWGDDIGPLLTWPIVLLVLAGIIDGVRRRDAFAVFLTANLTLGFLVESLLLGNQQAHRYMHANMWAAFGLVAYGARPALEHIKPWIWSPIMAGIALVIIGEAAISDVPRATQRGWLNTREQAQVATTVADHYPLPRDDMETRVHGVYFGETMGLGHYHEILEKADDPPPFSSEAHVLIAPEDLPIALDGLQVLSERIIDGNERRIRVLAFESRTTDLQLPTGLDSRWRESPHRKYSPSMHRIEATSTTAAELILMMSRSRGQHDQCSLAIRQTRTIRYVDVETPRYPELRLVRFPVKPGPLTIELGPCPTPRFFDLF